MQKLWIHLQKMKNTQMGAAISLDFFKENWILLVSILAVVLAVVIILIVVLSRRKKKKQGKLGSYSDFQQNQMPNQMPNQMLNQGQNNFGFPEGFGMMNSDFGQNSSAGEGNASSQGSNNFGSYDPFANDPDPFAPEPGPFQYDHQPDNFNFFGQESEANGKEEPNGGNQNQSPMDSYFDNLNDQNRGSTGSYFEHSNDQNQSPSDSYFGNPDGMNQNSVDSYFNNGNGMNQNSVDPYFSNGNGMNQNSVDPYFNNGNGMNQNSVDPYFNNTNGMNQNSVDPYFSNPSEVNQNHSNSYPLDMENVYAPKETPQPIPNNYDDDEKTMFMDEFDDEATLDGSTVPGVRVEFMINFDGQSSIQNYVVVDQLILGRGSDCDVDVVLKSMKEERKQTSRKHCFLILRPEGLFVKDNSKNKTFINGHEVLGEMLLRDQDVLQLGKAVVKVHILPEN